MRDYTCSALCALQARSVPTATYKAYATYKALPYVTLHYVTIHIGSFQGLPHGTILAYVSGLLCTYIGTSLGIGLAWQSFGT